MENSITIEEKFSKYWTLAFIGLALFSALSFLIYYNLEDTFWEGIWRVFSFIFFAGSIISLLKIMEGKREITITLKSNELDIIYRKKDEMILNDAVPLDKLEYINFIPYSYKVPLLDISYSSPTTFDVLVKLTDTNHRYHLLEYAGSELHIDKATAKSLIAFCQNHQIPVNTNQNMIEENYEAK